MNASFQGINQSFPGLDQSFPGIKNVVNLSGSALRSLGTGIAMKNETFRRTSL